MTTPPRPAFVTIKQNTSSYNLKHLQRMFQELPVSGATPDQYLAHICTTKSAPQHNHSQDKGKIYNRDKFPLPYFHTGSQFLGDLKQLFCPFFQLARAQKY
jgi:hypothetical protein